MAIHRRLSEHSTSIDPDKDVIDECNAFLESTEQDHFDHLIDYSIIQNTHQLFLLRNKITYRLAASWGLTEEEYKECFFIPPFFQEEEKE